MATRPDSAPKLSALALVRDLIAYLGSNFPMLSLADCEDLAQEAYAHLLAAERRGSLAEEPAALLRRIARRLALNLLRDHPRSRTEPEDPHCLALAERPSKAPGPDEILEIRAELAEGLEAAQQLPRECQEAYRLYAVEGLSASEVAKELGIARSTVIARVRRVLNAVERTRTVAGLPRQTERLLAVYVAGVATILERRRAERLLRADPVALARARELRAYHAALGALLPAVADPTSKSSILERVIGTLQGIRGAGGEAGPSIRERLGEQLASGRLRGPGAAGGGLLAKLAASGGVSKIIASCLAGGVLAAGCVAGGLIPGVGLPGIGGASAQPKRAHQPKPVVSETVERRPPVAATYERAATTPTRQASEPAPNRTTAAPASSATSTSTTTPLAPSTPAVQQQFGVAAATPGSGASPDRASVPSQSTGGSPAQQEFGP